MRECVGRRTGEQKKRKVEDDSANQTVLSAEWLPDHLTSDPRTGGVFKTHDYLY